MKVAFAHNVFDRYVTLKDTIDIENQLFPDSSISVANNGEMTNNTFQNMKNVKIVNFHQKTHKIGCVNGCILSLQQLLKEDLDVIVFSHDDVSINMDYITTVSQHLENIYNGTYDVICRKPSSIFGDNYYMMEVFYVSQNAAIEIFSNLTIFNEENKIPLDIRGSISPEVWLYSMFVNKNLKIKEITFEQNEYNKQLGEQMGYKHKNAGLRGWKD